jgi:hypothetical protein
MKGPNGSRKRSGQSMLPLGFISFLPSGAMP